VARLDRWLVRHLFGLRAATAGVHDAAQAGALMFGLARAVVGSTSSRENPVIDSGECGGSNQKQSSMAHRSTSDSTPGPSSLQDRTEPERRAANGIVESDEDLLLLFSFFFGELNENVVRG
jgi:hypothetical protein